MPFSGSWFMSHRQPATHTNIPKAIVLAYNSPRRKDLHLIEINFKTGFAE
jgi:hypothetical protein